MEKNVKTYFPKGCPLCKGKVILDEEHFRYMCKTCGAYAEYHIDDTPYSKKFEPSETMARGEMHLLRHQVRTEFSKLYRERLSFKNNNQVKDTALINLIYTDQLVKFKDRNKEYFAVVIQKDEDKITLSVIDTGKIITKEAESLFNISNRDKALVWLSHKMGLKTTKCNIGIFEKYQLKIAHEHIYKAQLEATKKANDSF